MSHSSGSKKISLFIASIISLITAGGLVIAHFLLEDAFGIVLAVLCIAEFIIVYKFMLYAIREFIIDRIAPIYQMIANQDISKKEIKEKLKSEDIGGVSDDVTAWTMKRSNEIRRLYDMERYRKDFLGNVSHELKTPIFNIQGYILTLLDGGIDDPEINRPYLENAEKNINRLINIVKDLDVITRLETGELVPEIKKFDLVKLVNEAFDSVELKAKQRNIKLKLVHNSGTVYVMGDRKRILQVLVNLLVNSITYGKDNGTTQVSFSETPDRILVNVADNGIGIDNKDIPRIFERFYRIDKHRSRDAGGSGLGLAIVKHIIEAHKQSMHIQSKLDVGSTFSFTLAKATIEVEI
ncbi:MAG: sensor histidine kinase [Prevotellaceae bacterium]|jgi:two-component system phosphate regulon sensor histidine kinase PhoR|nr:sensor histidine kinase [Prevotellaceae bacterium]